MQLELEGKMAVVTGASHGIGLAVATALAVEGVHVVAGSRDEFRGTQRPGGVGIGRVGRGRPLDALRPG